MLNINKKIRKRSLVFRKITAILIATLDMYVTPKFPFLPSSFLPYTFEVKWANHLFTTILDNTLFFSYEQGRKKQNKNRTREVLQLSAGTLTK